MREAILFEVDRGYYWKKNEFTTAIGKVTVDWCFAWWRRSGMKVLKAWWPIGREASCDDGLNLDFLLELEAPTVADGVDKTTAAWPSQRKGQ